MSRDRRAVLAGSLLVAVAWIGLRGLPSAATWLRDKEEAVQQRAELVERARTKVAGISALDDSIRALVHVADALPNLLLVGSDAETAAVDVMRRVREHVDAESVLLLGFEAYSAQSSSGPLELAGITVRLESDLRGILQTIDALAFDQALAVERLDIEALDSHTDDTLPERLHAAITVSAWYQPTESRGTGSLQAFAR